MNRRFLVSLIFPLLAVAFGPAAMAATLSPVTGTPGYQSVDGLSVYIGVVPAAILKGHPASHTESTMHGGALAAENEYHLVVAIFDSATGQRVTDARVEATVFGPGNTIISGQRHLPPWGTRPLAETLPKKPLEAMTIGETVTYGDFITLPEPATYTFRLTINRPGRSKPTVMNFVYDHRG